MNEIRIGRPKVEAGPGRTKVTFPIEGLEPADLRFSVSEGYEDFVDDGCDAAVVSLLPLAMAKGRSLVVEGPMSSRLLWNVRNTLVPVLRRALPFTRPVEVSAERLRREPREAPGAVLSALSCGVDSLSALQDHFVSDDVLEPFRVTHCFFGHIGHHGYGGDLDGRVERRRATIVQAAGELGLPVVEMWTNTPDFYPPEHDSPLNWMATMAPRNAAAPLLLQRGVETFLFASSHDWQWVGAKPTPDLSIADPILLPALGTERVSLHSVGSEHTRPEKTERIAGWELAHRYLDVCIIDGGLNCSRCPKCLRTLLTLEVLGALEHFADRFDMESYRAHRGDFIARVLAEKDDLFLVEIRTLMEERGFEPPRGPKLKARALRAWRWIPGELRRRARGVEERPPADFLEGA